MQLIKCGFREKALSLTTPQSMNLSSDVGNQQHSSEQFIYHGLPGPVMGVLAHYLTRLKYHFTAISIITVKYHLTIILPTNLRADNTVFTSVSLQTLPLTLPLKKLN